MKLYVAIVGVGVSVLGASSCARRSLVNIDVWGDQSYDAVTLRIGPAAVAPKIYPGVSLGTVTPLEVGLFVDETGSVRIDGDVLRGDCVVAHGEAVVANLKAGDSTSPLDMHVIGETAICVPDGGAGDVPSGSGGAGAGGGGSAGAAGGGVGGSGVGGGGGVAAGSGSGGSGSGGAGTGGVAGSGGAGVGGRGGSGSGGTLGTGGRVGTGGTLGTGGIAGTGGARAPAAPRNGRSRRPDRYGGRISASDRRQLSPRHHRRAGRKPLVHRRGSQPDRAHHSRGNHHRGRHPFGFPGQSDVHRDRARRKALVHGVRR